MLKIAEIVFRILGDPKMKRSDQITRDSTLLGRSEKHGLDVSQFGGKAREILVLEPHNLGSIERTPKGLRDVKGTMRAYCQFQ